MEKRELTARKLDALCESTVGDVPKVIEAARQSAARTLNSIMNARYWLHK